MRIRLSATFDEWTCISTKAYLTITVSWVDPVTGILHRRVVRLRSFPSATDKITADLLRANLIDTFKPLLEIEADVEKLLPSIFQAFTTDTAAVPLAVSKNYPKLRVRCICHVIHLIFGDLFSPTKMPVDNDDVDDAIENPAEHAAAAQQGSQGLKEILRDCKALLSKFTNSSKVRRNFEERAKQQFPGERLLLPIYDVPTRWLSTVHLFLRLMEDWPILKMMTATELGFKSAETYKWTELKDVLNVHMLQLPAIVDLLRPYMEFTTFFQSNAITSSFVCMAATQLYNHTKLCAEASTSTSLLKGIANALLASTTKRLGHYVNVVHGQPQPNGQPRDPLTSLAQLADPRTWRAATTQPFADGTILTPNIASAQRRLLMGDVDSFQPGLIQLAEDALSTVAGVFPQRVYDDDLQRQPIGDRAHFKEKLEDEIVAYVRAVAGKEGSDVIPSSKDTDVLQFIATPAYKSKYTLWAPLQMTLLSISASSAESERVFSLAALVKTRLRNRLSESMLELLALLSADARQQDPAVGVYPDPTASTRRVETAKRMATGMPRRQAISEARAANAPQPGSTDALRTATPMPEDDDNDDDDDDEGPLMEAMLAAGCQVDDTGSLILDEIGNVLDSDVDQEPTAGMEGARL